MINSIKTFFRGMAWFGKNGRDFDSLMDAAYAYRGKQSSRDTQSRLDIGEISNLRNELVDLRANLDIIANHLITLHKEDKL